MFKSRSFIGGPRWPAHRINGSGGPGFFSTGTLAALNDRIIMYGTVQSDDGLPHVYDTVAIRTVTSSLVGTIRVSLRDMDLTTGPPGRDDGNIDQSATQSNPTSNTVYSLTLDAGRTLAHGAPIAVVVDVSAFTSGTVQIASMSANTLAHDPGITSFIASTYANVAGVMPNVTLESPDGHRAVLMGGMPACSAVSTVAINTGTAEVRAGLGFSTVTSVWGLEGRILISPAAGADFDIRLYNGTSLVSSMSKDSNTWGIDAQARWVHFCFPDIEFVPNQNYYVVLVPTTTNSATMYTFTSTAARWAPLTGTNGGGSVGYATHNGTAWSSINTDVLPFMDIQFLGVSGVKSGNRLNIL